MRLQFVLFSVVSLSLLTVLGSLAGCKSSGKVFRNHWGGNSASRPAEMERADSGSTGGGVDDGALSPSDRVLGPHASVLPSAQSPEAASNHALLARESSSNAYALTATTLPPAEDASYDSRPGDLLVAASPVAAQTIAFPLNRPGPSETVTTQAITPNPTNANSAPPPAIAPANAAQVPSSPTLELEIRGVRAGRGDIKLAVFDSESAFPTPTKAIKTLNLKSDDSQIRQGTMTVALAMDRAIAIAVFQDIDGDGHLGRNRLGIPVEPFAFSNNAMGRRGPPEFAAALIKPPIDPHLPWRTSIQLP